MPNDKEWAAIGIVVIGCCILGGLFMLWNAVWSLFV